MISAAYYTARCSDGSNNLGGIVVNPGLRIETRGIYVLLDSVEVVGVDLYGVVAERGEAGGFYVDYVVLVLERTFY
jgi:hypothetical protein